MPKFTVYLNATVPIFAHLEIEADTPAQAIEQVRQVIANEETKITTLAWEYGESGFVPVGSLDERDLSTVEVTDAVIAATT